MITAIRTTELKDLPALAQFLIRVFQFDPSDYHANPQLLEWKYLRLRPGSQGSRSYVLEKNGQIVAHCGTYPVTFHLPDGTTVKSMNTGDWAADPSAPGSGVMLFRMLMEFAPTSIVIGGAPPTRQIIPQIGFRPVGEALTYSAWLRPWREFRRRPLTQRSALRLLHGLTHPAPNRWRASDDWDFVPVNRFDDSVLPVLNGKNRAWTFCERTVADLNYLLQCPHLEMRGFLLRRHGQLIGYFMIGRAEWEARLLDLVVDSAEPQDWNLAVAIVIQAARLDPEACRIRALASIPILSEALAWSGFWPQYSEPFLIHDPKHALAHAFPVSLQLFDGDAGY